MRDRCIAPHEIQPGDLLAFIEGAASPRVARHIAVCPLCAAEVKELRQIDRLFQRAFGQPEQSIANVPANDPVLAGNGRATPPPLARPSLTWNGWTRLGHALQSRSRRRAALSLIPLVLLLILIGAAYHFLRRPATTPPSQVTLASRPVPLEAPASPAESRSKAEPADSAPIAPQGASSPSTGLAIEKDPAIAPPRSILQMLEQEYDGLLEPAAAIAPPRHLRRLLQEQFQDRAGRLVAYSQTNAEPYWTESVVVDPTRRVSHLIWVEPGSGFNRLYAAQATDPTQGPTGQVLVAQAITDIFNPILALDSQANLYVVWRSGRYTNASVFFARSTDGGQSWSPGIRINEAFRQTRNPSLTIDPQGHLYVAWQDHRSAATDIYLTRSPDGGQTWSREVRMAN